MKKPDEYRSTHMVEVDPDDYDSSGYLSLEVLPFLKGRKWDEISLAFVTSVKPTSIRVTEGNIKCDAREGRVTVYVDEKSNIIGITQEVEVWLPEDVQHGDDLHSRVDYAGDLEWK